ncbi:(deoxy)nucleoside triphosphate pyrophosphohydrolase [Lutimonas saemankumensis]|uniref:(deoxy)nucleoside triphosphate pyrophosphohydrolase n=1 Tax=Lutimonas saemankumensis TaxID=483016 RepID=UPI001CD6046B|nr:(deoxy)nucleoside triphosphate pyrophosphohydrolase [Lutimonas saemankumensis]MCA0931724.1 (deoxy)nucleoside triphosphate pyrophosphohydrolase [Lutimonas saemankumensis]
MIKVVAGVIKKDAQYFIARRASHKDQPGKWEFPGGKIETAESPEMALERELYEEFKIRTQTGKYLIQSICDYSDFQIQLLAYESKYLSGEFELSDHDKIAWVELQEMDRFDMNKADYPIIEFLKNRSQK